MATLPSFSLLNLNYRFINNTAYSVSINNSSTNLSYMCKERHGLLSGRRRFDTLKRFSIGNNNGEEDNKSPSSSNTSTEEINKEDNPASISSARSPGISPDRPIFSNFQVDSIKLMELLGPEKVDPADVKIIKDKLFGYSTFWVTKEEPFGDLGEGVLFLGNLRGKREEVFAKLQRQLTEVTGDKYNLFMVEEPNSEGPDPRGGARVSFGLLRKEVSEPGPTTLWQYVIALLLFVLTAGSCVELGIASQITSLPPEVVKYFTDPNAVEPPDMQLLVPYVESALPLAYGVLGVQLFHEIGHSLAAFPRKVKLGIPFFIPNITLGSFGAITQVSVFNASTMVMAAPLSSSNPVNPKSKPPPSSSTPEQPQIPPLPDPTSCVFPHPLPPPQPPPLVPPQNPPLPEVRWTSLFAKKPWNAGAFEPPPLSLKYDGKRLVPTPDVVEASKDEWQEYLTGFFLDTPLSYTAVVSHLFKLWKPRGTFKVKSNGSFFFFRVDDMEDRKRILEADPILIRNKVFIVRTWDVNMGLSGKGIRNVPIWVKLINLPMVAWSKIGICWLATHIGKFLCMDQATESLNWLGFAKCLVEISPESELPETITVLLPDGTEHDINVIYTWRPDICCICKVFGHKRSNCPLSKDNENPDKTRNVSDNFGKQTIRAESNDQAGGSADVRRQTERISRRSNVTSEWRRVRENTSTRFAYVAPVLSTENSFGALNNIGGDEVCSIEEGEIVEGLTDRDLNKNFAAYNEPSKAAPSQNIGTEENSQTDADLSMPQENAVAKEVCLPEENSSEQEMIATKDALKTIMEDVSEYERTMNTGGLYVHLPLTASETSLSNVCGFKSGFLQGTSPHRINQSGSQQQNSKHVLQTTVASNDSQKVNSAEHENADLDGFLHNNFNLSPVTNSKSRKLSRTKEKVKVNIDKTVLETIDSLGFEIESGDLDPHTRSEKKKLMDLMAKNYAELQSRKATIGKGRKENLNPYANIPPPPGYKPRPPDIIVPNKVASTSIASTSAGKSPQTRSMTRAQMNAPFDNG